jgi:hypothetical protein
MAPQKVSNAAANAFDDDMSIVDLPTFGKGGKRHGRSVDAAVRGDGTKRQKVAATKKVIEDKATDAAGGKEKASASSEKAVEVAKCKT